MRLLLDTHIFLWLQTVPERLGAQHSAALAVSSLPRLHRDPPVSTSNAIHSFNNDHVLGGRGR